MDQAIKEFFNERKEAWLKKNLKKDMPPDEEQKLREECEENFSLDNWLPDAARRANELFMATHPPKFSHPDIKGKNITSVIFNGVKKDDGFLRTGNCEAGIDIYGNAAALDVYKFLSLKFDDNKTVLDHLEQGSQTVKEQLHISTASFEEIQKGFLCIKQGGEETKTSGLIKQVYFPLDALNDSSLTPNPSPKERGSITPLFLGKNGDGQQTYHLLSILTSSGLVFELKKRIDNMAFSEETKEARQLRKKEEYSEHGFDEVLNLTRITYGGTKPQNISVLNSNSGGKVYLLPSLPPVLKKRDIRLPKYDFFQNCLWVNNFKESFEAMHKLLIIEYNNINIREGIKNRILSIMDQVIEQSWSIRKHDAGWSEGERYSNLPDYQKIWLDDIRIEERESSDSWLDKVIYELARWIIDVYRKSHGNSGVNLGDDEILPVKKIIMESKEALL